MASWIRRLPPKEEIQDSSGMTKIFAQNIWDYFFFCVQVHAGGASPHQPAVAPPTSVASVGRAAFSCWGGAGGDGTGPAGRPWARGPVRVFVASLLYQSAARSLLEFGASVHA